jgi:hypothetical protein
MAQTFTQVLYRLLSHPEYIEPLRQEAESVIAEEGWTKVGVDKMHKLDSFLRETQRIDGLGISLSASLHRFPVTDTCLSSGFESSRTTPIHIFQWHDHSGGYAYSPSAQCCPYG